MGTKTIIIILSLLLGIALGTVIFYALGLLICNILSIGYTWTIWHGPCCELLFVVAIDLFRQS